MLMIAKMNMYLNELYLLGIENYFHRHKNLISIGITF